MSDYAPYEDADDCIAQQDRELTRLRAREAVLVNLLSETLECMVQSDLSDRIEKALATISEE